VGAVERHHVDGLIDGLLTTSRGEVALDDAVLQRHVERVGGEPGAELRVGFVHAPQRQQGPDDEPVPLASAFSAAARASGTCVSAGATPMTYTV
jgi:hypothetical protein